MENTVTTQFKPGVSFEDTFRARATGLLVFDTPEGPSHCTASLLNTPAGNVLVTAAHCIATYADNPGDPARPQRLVWVKNLMFIPGYDARPNRPAGVQQEPFGRWVIERALIPTQMVEAGPAPYDPDLDVAVLTVHKDSDGRRLGEKIAGVRYRIAEKAEQGLRLTSLGYPGTGKYNGTHQYACSGPAVAARGAYVLKDCLLAGGMSGGPAFIDSSDNYPTQRTQIVVAVTHGEHQESRSGKDTLVTRLRPATFGALLGEADPKASVD
ncbi:hypothetical protein NBRGN_026_00840 [Nocardia brasiliensis NBRC 14402]|nr:hypothetical protein NBRGN_026_00840 [Nocardia brasiliensis NBRC 14402]